MAVAKQAKQFYMKPWFWALVVIVVIGLWLWGTYNSLVVASINVDNKWAQVQTQYQRRFDLIPRLVNVTSSYATFEKNTFTEITQLRSQWESTSDPNQRVQIAQQSDGALTRLLAVFENYPTLRSVEAYRALQDELSGTENRISVARMDYNNAVRDYNVAIRVVPANIIAGLFGFKERSYFLAASGAENAPGVPGNIGV
jgi:LemA protein